MNKYTRLGKNTALVFLGNAGSKFIGLLMLPFYTRWLSIEDYGLTDIITVYVTFLIGIVTCCIGESLFIFPKNQKKEIQKKYFSSATSFCLSMLLLTGLIFFVIEIVLKQLQIQNSFSQNIWLIYLMLVSNVIQQISQQFVRSIDKIVIYSTTGIVLTFATALFAFIFIPCWGVKGYVLSIILANTCSSIYSFIFSKSYNYFSFKENSLQALVSMLKYSVPLIPNGIMWWLVNALNRPVMETYLGFHDMGIFAVANKFPGILTVIFGVFGTSWQISVIEEFGKDGYCIFYNKILRLVFTLLAIVLMLLTLFSKVVISIFATSDFYEAWQYIPFLTFGVLFSNIAGFAGTNFSATRESKYYFYSSIWGAIVAIIMNFVFIPLLGIWGACISVIFSFFMMAVCRIWYSWKYVKIADIQFYIILLLFLVIMMVLYVKEVNPIIIASVCILMMYYLYVHEKDILFMIVSRVKSKMKFRD